MTNLKLILNKIIIGIDRIEFTLPRAYLKSLQRHLKESGTQISVKPYKKYNYKKYLILEHKVTVKYLDEKYSTASFRDRVYLTVSDPNSEIQCLLKYILSDICAGISKGFAGVLIKQIEVSYDMYCAEEQDSHKLKKYIDHHLVLKHARTESYNTIKTTDYVGRNGDIRKGAKGSRSYVKKENNELFYRLEMQYNRPYISSNDLTIHELPFNPLLFNSLDNIELLDDFSAKGLINISRSLLRKKGITESSCRNFYQLHRKKMQSLRSQLLTETRWSRRPVHTQIAKLKSIKKESGLSVNFKHYFKPLHHVRQLICCHADVGYLENCCSKRMAWCQTV